MNALNLLPGLRRHGPRSRAIVTILLGLIAIPFTSCTIPSRDDDATVITGSIAATTSSQLNSLPIKGRAPKTGYSREQFGESWSDDVATQFGHNGCDTRNDILNRDLTDKTFKKGTHDCVVLTGVLNDPYTGAVIHFQRGQKTSAAVQIDHLVPLSDAWQKGAQAWDDTKRRNFANDPANLLAVDGPTNSAKSDSDAATWLPPDKSYRCTYAQKIISVKAAYGLWVTQAEHDALARQLATC